MTTLPGATPAMATMANMVENRIGSAPRGHAHG